MKILKSHKSVLVIKRGTLEPTKSIGANSSDCTCLKYVKAKKYNTKNCLETKLICCDIIIFV